MKRTRSLWLPLLLGVLLIATLVGVASARPDARPQEQAWRVLTVPSTVCIPQEDDDDWFHYAQRVECTGTCVFFCAVDFPAAGEQAVGAVNVKRVTMYAFDNTGAATWAHFQLAKSHPPSAGFAEMAGGYSQESPADPQSVMDSTIANNPVYRVQGPTVGLTITGTGIKVYGFHIHYTW
jgi:hypothetical protein